MCVLKSKIYSTNILIKIITFIYIDITIYKIVFKIFLLCYNERKIYNLQAKLCYGELTFVLICKSFLRISRLENFVIMLLLKQASEKIRLLCSFMILLYVLILKKNNNSCFIIYILTLCIFCVIDRMSQKLINLHVKRC